MDNLIIFLYDNIYAIISLLHDGDVKTDILLHPCKVLQKLVDFMLPASAGLS